MEHGEKAVITPTTWYTSLKTQGRTVDLITIPTIYFYV